MTDKPATPTAIDAEALAFERTARFVKAANIIDPRALLRVTPEDPRSVGTTPAPCDPGPPRLGRPRVAPVTR